MMGPDHRSGYKLPEPPTLKKCPFCDGHAEFCLNALYGDNSMARCRQCGATAFWVKWNNRAPSPPPEKILTRLPQGIVCPQHGPWDDATPPCCVLTAEPWAMCGFLSETVRILEGHVEGLRERGVDQDRELISLRKCWRPIETADQTPVRGPRSATIVGTTAEGYVARTYCINGDWYRTKPGGGDSLLWRPILWVPLPEPSK